MAGAKRRSNTKRGMGDVEGGRPPITSTRPPPISVPSVKMPCVEDVGESSGPDSARGTLKRFASSADAIARVTLASVPSLTAGAGALKGKRIEPSDAFLLSRIDGQLKAEDLADLTGMTERDVLASLTRLAIAGLVTIA